MEWRKDKPNLIAVASDCHLGAPHREINNDPAILVDMFNKYKNAVCLGDIVDMANVQKSKVNFWIDIKSMLKRLYGDRFIIGNHSCEPIGSGYTIIEVSGKRVLFFHGPGVYINNIYYPVYYSEEKTEKWANKKHGRGKWSYWKYSTFRSVSKHKGGYKRPSNEILERVYIIANKLKIDMAVWGHTHRTYSGLYKNIRMENVGKGISFVEV